ncbi:replication-associated recombination protein A [Haliovirga abyssi]|uniref:Recombinase RarA n=1 Tax=Haliovirga abyssi TaxID=2996794 RepID=A0AAU9D2B9_9FUSO|nr:replication-associated recombination protein A [Haliovirga abyssi]BDU50141.1 recombinase RarA [Haliovirga abyssi]
MNNLFYSIYKNKMPLAFRFRPKKLEDYIGQNEILSENKILFKLIKKKNIVNSIFYGPPGTGKTSLAEVISNEVNGYFENLNATTATVKDIKNIVENAEKKLKIEGKQTILFLDEIHRFNKLQQDSLLPSTEKGTIVLIGATTENPYYTLNNSLLSRCLVFEFNKLKNKDIKQIIRNVEQKITNNNIQKIDDEIIDYISKLSNGDARQAINYLQLIIDLDLELDIKEIKEILGKNRISYDKKEDKYNIISAYIKSIRGSDPDSSIYWLAKMLVGGEDPKYIARRLMILAAEDIGLANPDALVIANAALNAAKEIGMPEIRIILSEATIYLAISTKSNSSYEAINNAIKDVESGINYEVPKHLLNIPDSGYKYPHSFEGNFVNQKYVGNKVFYYKAGNNKNENMIMKKLKKMWEWDNE